MLAKIIRGSIANRYFVLLAAAALAVWGWLSLKSTSIDAIPDLSDTQVIVYTEYPGQSPKTVEDQVTYPLTTQLVSVPGSKAVRGYSFFGYSLVFIIFQDGTDVYWARSRVLEYLNGAQKRLPEGAVPTLGPDASGVGWVYEYALTSGKRSLQELRSFQDWYLKYSLSSVPGAAEVASIGGFVKQYQITVDPAKLLSYGVSVHDLETALKNGNSDAGGEVIELSEMEFMLQSCGYLRSLEDIRNIPIRNNAVTLAALKIGDVAQVSIGPEMRRGAADLNGEGETAGGIVVMRSGANARQVIAAVKKKLEELKAGLPDDVNIIPVYDRSGLIDRAVDNLSRKLIEEMIAVVLVCLLFLFHARSALVAAVALPLAVLMAFIVMKTQGISANIMSLGGIAIAIGAMVDAAIIMIENAHKHIERESLLPAAQQRSLWQIVSDAATEVGPALFFSLLVITVAFIPVFTLEEQEGRLFRPLAFTKTYAMAAAALLSITLVPVLMGFFIRGKIKKESGNPLNRLLIRLYHPLVKIVVHHPFRVIGIAILLLACTLVPLRKIGSEFMPSLWEGDLLYMPTTLPGVSIAKSKEILQQTDRIIKSFPEVERVFGKAGRAETATDPAGLDMLETIIMLKPESEWRPGMTRQKLIAALDSACRFPGLTNSWTMPIKTRIDMLSTGIKTPVGVKISGPNLDTLEKIGQNVEAVVKELPNTASAIAERTVGGNYVDIEICRTEAARFGINVSDINSLVSTALGGMTVTTTVEGLERYPVNLRYSRELRGSVEDLKRIPVPTPDGRQIPLGQVASITLQKGPMLIRSEGSRPNAWVFIDVRNQDLGSYSAMAQQAVREQVKLPSGYNLVWSGEFEYLERMRSKMAMVIPFTLCIIILLLYLNTRSLVRTGIILLAVPFSLIGAFWTVYLLGYNMSVAVWVGIIALAGLDAETGVIMLLYLEQALARVKNEKGANLTETDLREAIDEGAVRRVRPKIMTATVIVAGLLPILLSHGTGADVMKRIAAPMAGGVVTSVLMELMVYPAVFYLIKKRECRENQK